LKKGFDLDVKNPSSLVQQHELGVKECLTAFRTSMGRVEAALAAVEKEYVA